MTDFTSISELAPRLRRREISPVEITRGCLARIEKLNPSLNAFITVMSESGMEQARRAEAEIGRGEWRGALHGV
ncbi:MAG TPA: amidase family protein, partial [Geobacterales bacterium]|nr:amidase family protein [Geobacterales bacterium]